VSCIDLASTVVLIALAAPGLGLGFLPSVSRLKPAYLIALFEPPLVDR
jgi:hypothetical protein